MADILLGLVDLEYNVAILFIWFILIAFLYNLSASINKVDKSRVHLSCWYRIFLACLWIQVLQLLI